MGDRQAAELCGVVDTGHREDAYTTIYTIMKEYLGEGGSIERNQVKEAIMTALYGSEAVPKRVFGEGSKMLGLFYKTMEVMAPGAWWLNEAFLCLWNPTALKYSWVLPDNFHVHTKVESKLEETVIFKGGHEKIVTKVNEPTKQGRSLGANTIHSIDGYVVRELTRRCMYDSEQIMQVKTALCFNGTSDEMGPSENERMIHILWKHYERTGMLSARILDYINEDSVHLVPDRQVIWKLIYSMPKKPFQVITVHDCFKTLPNYGNDLRRQYNILLAEIAKSDLLNALLEDITGRNIGVEKLDPEMHKDVLEANYALS